MTREELDNLFQHPMYDDFREDLIRIMDAHPEITDRGLIEYVAEQIHECRGDGVDLSVENAMRLASHRPPPVPIADLVKSLNEAGVTNENVFDVVSGIMDMELPTPTGEAPKQSAVAKAEKLVSYAKKLTEKNEDIILLGVPDIDPGWGFAQLKLAILAESLTAEEQKILFDMKCVADSVNMGRDNGYDEVLFYIDSL